MGFLTTITIRNDGANELKKKNAEKVTKILNNACNKTQIDNGYDEDYLGSGGNMFILQKPRHADDTTLFLHAGNTVVDVFNAKSEWAIDTYISEMEYHLKRLKKLKKENKLNNK